MSDCPASGERGPATGTATGTGRNGNRTGTERNGNGVSGGWDRAGDGGRRCNREIRPRRAVTGSTGGLVSGIGGSEGR